MRAARRSIQRLTSSSASVKRTLTSSSKINFTPAVLASTAPRPKKHVSSPYEIHEHTKPAQLTLPTTKHAITGETHLSAQLATLVHDIRDGTTNSKVKPKEALAELLKALAISSTRLDQMEHKKISTLNNLFKTIMRSDNLFLQDSVFLTRLFTRTEKELVSIDEFVSEVQYQPESLGTHSVVHQAFAQEILEAQNCSELCSKLKKVKANLSPQILLTLIKDNLLGDLLASSHAESVIELIRKIDNINQKFVIHDNRKRKMSGLSQYQISHVSNYAVIIKNAKYAADTLKYLNKLQTDEDVFTKSQVDEYLQDLDDNQGRVPGINIDFAPYFIALSNFKSDTCTLRKLLIENMSEAKDIMTIYTKYYKYFSVADLEKLNSLHRPGLFTEINTLIVDGLNDDFILPITHIPMAIDLIKLSDYQTDTKNAIIIACSQPDVVERFQLVCQAITKDSDITLTSEMIIDIVEKVQSDIRLEKAKSLSAGLFSTSKQEGVYQKFVNDLPRPTI